jgi:hypothetical protein
MITDLGIDHLEDEELVAFGTDGAIYPLSDPDSIKQRRYPGAPVVDKKAAVGRQLRGHAADLVIAAIRRLRDGRSMLKLGRRDKAALRRRHSQGGVPLAARIICWEANLLKQHQRADLAEHRFLSIDVCRRVLRNLVATGALIELQEMERFRANRQWRCNPAVYALPVTRRMRT